MTLTDDQALCVSLVTNDWPTLNRLERIQQTHAQHTRHRNKDPIGRRRQSVNPADVSEGSTQLHIHKGDDRYYADYIGQQPPCISPPEVKVRETRQLPRPK